jgi:hypothetical protein
MKDWQKGFELDYLKTLASKYDSYNSYTLSPFVEVKKNNIADMLDNGTLKIVSEDTMFDVSVSKTSSPITMHGKTVIANKQIDDITFSKMTGNIVLLQQEIKKYTEDMIPAGRLFSPDCWIYVWAEDAEMNKLANNCGFHKVGPKITTFGEMYMIYYRGMNRPFPIIDKAEYASIKMVGNVNSELIESIYTKLQNLPSFTNHYSNYNKKKSWGALSLRGYRPEPEFITKPIEMSDKWKEENKDIHFELQDTVMYNDFPEVRELLKEFGDKVHRVRFMRLKPGGGELERHTDQVDPDSGGSLGKVARLHFPIKTNDDVIFTVWGTQGNAQEIHMAKNECWFLDTRKPHRALNGGNEERIHLVVDIETEEKLHSKII